MGHKLFGVRSYIRDVNVMDMCYDGTLVLPSNYAVMDEEEMMLFGMSRTYIVICF